MLEYGIPSFHGDPFLATSAVAGAVRLLLSSLYKVSMLTS